LTCFFFISYVFLLNLLQSEHDSTETQKVTLR